MIGVALFDLWPEALNLADGLLPQLAIATAQIGGFVVYLGLDVLANWYAGRGAKHRGHLGPFSLVLHSAADGLAIGIALHLAPAVALIVAVAVISHDFVDGANAVTLCLGEGTGIRTARRWLVIDAIAPGIGVTVARFSDIPTSMLCLLLAILSGMFLYIGARQLFHRNPVARFQPRFLVATGAGTLIIYAIARIARI